MFSEGELLSAVKASPAAVAVHDKHEWLKLFAVDAEVNDPVGSRPHRGRAAIGRFYDTFIAPNDIRFDVDHDVVCGDTVVRDLVIKIRMPTGLTVDVPTHIRYELIEEAGRPRIRRLYAHWELMPMVLGTLASGVKGLTTYARLSARMLGCQGAGGVAGFMRGFFGVGRVGRRRAEALLAALRDGDTLAANALLAPAAAVELPAGARLQTEQAADRLRQLTWTKLIAAGRYVTATVWVGEARGVVLLAFDRRRNPELLRFYIAAG